MDQLQSRRYTVCLYLRVLNLSSWMLVGTRHLRCSSNRICLHNMNSSSHLSKYSQNWIAPCKGCAVLFHSVSVNVALWIEKSIAWEIIFTWRSTNRRCMPNQVFEQHDQWFIHTYMPIKVAITWLDYKHYNTS